MMEANVCFAFFSTFIQKYIVYFIDNFNAMFQRIAVSFFILNSKNEDMLGMSLKISTVLHDIGIHKYSVLNIEKLFLRPK